MPLLTKVARTFLPNFVAKTLGFEEAADKKEDQAQKVKSTVGNFAESLDKIKLFLDDTFGSAEEEFDKVVDKVIYKSQDVLSINSIIYIDTEAGQTYPTVGEFAEVVFPLDLENTNQDAPLEKVVSAFMADQQNSLNNFISDLEEKVQAEFAALAKARAKAKSKHKEHKEDDEVEEEELKEPIVRVKNDAQMIAAAFRAYSHIVSIYHLGKKVEDSEPKSPLSESDGKKLMQQAKEARLLLRGLADVYPNHYNNLREVATTLSQIEIKMLAKEPESKPQTAPARRATI